MQHNNVEIRIGVKNKPIVEYTHNGDTFVEGREGSEFDIEFINRNPFRVEAIITVDGLSVIDGKEGSMESSGFLVEANSSLCVPGWKLDNEQAAKFVFSGKGGSYATAMTGSSRNNGVIGAMVFAERHRRPVTKTRERPNVTGWVGQLQQQHQPPLWNGQPSVSMGYVNTVHSTAGAITKGLGVYGQNTTSARPGTEALSPFDIPRYYSGNQTDTMSWMDSEPTRGMTKATTQVEDYYFGSGPDTKSATRTRGSQVTSLNNLGTGFGAATTFETETVTFERGDLVGMLILYYDNATGLRQRGIQVGRPSRARHTAQTPQAFPGMVKGCTPPPNWKG